MISAKFLMKILVEDIQKKAFDLGFSLCGFTDDFVPKKKHYFLNWLKEKRFAQMTWMEKNTDKRLGPHLVFEKTKSVIVLAISYAHEPKGKDYQLARYAYGADYHLWVKDLLEELAHFIQSRQKEFLWRSFVDTGPILERDLAQKAGLGWIGKNTCLLNDALGSYLFLGVVLCNLELLQSRDTPVPFAKGAKEAECHVPTLNQCGSCRLCLEACPTQALTPYQLDPYKCLAYQNIEKRGKRDEEFWGKFSDRLMGCDICQEVCPYNKGRGTLQRTPTDWQRTFSDFELGDLKGLLQLDDKNYQAKTKYSAISRVKYPDFMRNVFLVIANMDRRDLLEDLFVWQKQNPSLSLEEFDYCVKSFSKSL